MRTKLLIFGISGDLSRRKLLPALKRILLTEEFQDDLSIIGVSRQPDDVRQILTRSLGDDSLADKFSMFTMDLAKPAKYHELKKYINLQDDEQLLAYFSVPPSIATSIVDFMGEAGINTPNVKILFEKPFGVDLASAEDIIARTTRYFKEEQLYRIDHYLAKEMSQNIVAFRGGNALFSHIWNNQAIESIEVLATEKIDIEGRAQFYEQTGALRDLVQGHLMQLLALTLMEIPAEFDWDTLASFRLKALEQLTIADPADTYRAQYKGYQDEVANEGSLVETFASVGLTSNDPRWKNTPIRLVTGKALSRKTTEVRIHLKKQRLAQSNKIIFRIQPNEGISIELYIKKPGYDRQFERRSLSFSYPEDEVLPDAYEQVIVDAIRSRKSLFTSGDEVLRSWKILSRVQESWHMDNDPLPLYRKGSSLKQIHEQLGV
ncbi:MAG: glucose-6-phosphate dehydrogenase [Candidatus Saccharimonas sp.]